MTTPAEYKKPLPRPLHPTVSAPYWEALKRHEIVIQRCRKCSAYSHYPRETCVNCLAMDFEWAPVSGKGVVYTYTIIYQAAHPAFQEETPYPYAYVLLDEGIKLPTNITGCEPSDISIGMRVEAVFDDVTPEWTLLKFRPA